MRNLLIVSPHFPPVNTPDMHRVRISLPHFCQHGWQPIVLAVAPDQVEGPLDPGLEDTLPEGLEVWRENALPIRWARRFGVGNLGIRAFWWLYRRGCRLIEEQRVSLNYFSTTVFTALPLGRLWKKRYGIPYVIDMQDPWIVEYRGSEHPSRREGSWKRSLAAGLHRTLEPWTMAEVDGILAVSEDYLDVLRHRYPRLCDVPAATLPFGFSEADFELLRAEPRPNRFFSPRRNGVLNGVYVGRGGRDMEPALRAIFGAFRKGLQQAPQLFGEVNLHFVGTDYAPPPGGTPTVAPVAEEMGLAGRVRESVQRIPYFEALQLLLDSDFLIVPGSDDPQYTASKIYPYVLAGKPLLCVFHERSSVVQLVRSTGCGRVVSFRSGEQDGLVERLLGEWTKLLESLGEEPPVRSGKLARYSGGELTRSQCQLFADVLARQT